MDYNLKDGKNMEKIIKASVIYKCPKTNQKVQTKISCYNYNCYIDCKESYDNTYSVYLRIYKCKSCGKEHEIELN